MFEKGNLVTKKGKYTDARLAEIMNYIEAYQEEHGFSPTIREIGEALGVKSSSLVDYYVRILMDKGYIERKPNSARSFTILHDYQGRNVQAETVTYSRKKTVKIPIVGKLSEIVMVAENDVVNHASNDNDYIELPAALFNEISNKEKLIALIVEDNQFECYGLKENDILIVFITDTANEKNTVVVKDVANAIYIVSADNIDENMHIISKLCLSIREY